MDIPFFLSWARAKRPSERYPKEVRSEFSSMVILDEENEEDDDEGKESMLKLFLMLTQLVLSNCTPKRRSPTKLVVAPLKDVQVLELWPMVPQCEHFLPIINYSHFNKDYFLTPPPSNQNQTVICMCICESVCVCGRERESRKNGLV